MIGELLKKYNTFGNYTGQILDPQGNISFHNNVYNYCKRALDHNIGIFGTHAKWLYCAYNNNNMYGNSGQLSTISINDHDVGVVIIIL